MNEEDDRSLSLATMTVDGFRTFANGSKVEHTAVILMGLSIWGLLYVTAMRTLTMELELRVLISALVAIAGLSFFLTIMFTRARGSPLLNLALPHIVGFLTPMKVYDVLYGRKQSFVEMSQQYTSLFMPGTMMIGGVIPIFIFTYWYTIEDRSDWERAVMPGEFHPRAYLWLAAIRGNDQRAIAEMTRMSILFVALFIIVWVFVLDPMDPNRVEYLGLRNISFFGLLFVASLPFIHKNYKG